MAPLEPADTRFRRRDCAGCSLRAFDSRRMTRNSWASPPGIPVGSVGMYVKLELRQRSFGLEHAITRTHARLAQVGDACESTAGAPLFEAPFSLKLRTRTCARAHRAVVERPKCARIRQQRARSQAQKRVSGRHFELDGDARSSRARVCARALPVAIQQGRAATTRAGRRDLRHSYLGWLARSLTRGVWSWDKLRQEGVGVTQRAKRQAGSLDSVRPRPRSRPPS